MTAESKAGAGELVVAVAESTPTHQERACQLLAELGCSVTPERGVDAVAARCAGSAPPDLVVVGVPGAEPVIEAVTGRLSERPVMVAAMAGPATTANARCAEAGADLLVIRPHGLDSMGAMLRAVRALRDERRKLAAASSSEAMLRERLLRYGQADAETGFQHLDFFQQLLVREIKRAKRYDYPLAACLVELDPLPEDVPPGAVRGLRTRVASAISACLRDIDLPVDLEGDRFLVFLPYTDLEGAQQVGERVCRAVGGFDAVEHDGNRLRVSVSIGISATRPGKPISFARLMREASAAVRASQLKGGGQVVVRR